MSFTTGPQPPVWRWDRSHQGPIGNQPDPIGWFHRCRLTPWWRRVLASLVDWGMLMCLWGVFAQVNETLATAVTLPILFLNSGVAPALTTYSAGKFLLGIRMVHVRKDAWNRAYVAFVPWWVACARIPLHYLDYLPAGIGWLLPIVNKSGGTIADMCTRVLHFSDPNLPPPQHIKGLKFDWPG